MQVSAQNAPPEEAELDWMAKHIAGNRFIPIPPPEHHFVGDGDFRAIGAEFLRYFARIGGLAPHDRVLDIGCGIGRMALPLTQYLDPNCGAYDGVDVVRDGIAWCGQAITPVYGNFRFHHLDLFHPLYNATGKTKSTAVRLPFDDASFSFIVMVSVTTHLMADEMRAYAAEIGRVLAPGGRCFVTAFLMNAPARKRLQQGQQRLPFDVAAPGPVFTAFPDNPTAAVAHDEDAFIEIFRKAGLRRVRQTVYGHWCGRASATFQDICVFGNAR